MTLSQKDLKLIGQIVDERLDAKLDEKLDEKLSHLPTKDEFYTKMDEVMGELQAMREELTIVNHRTSGHDDRITSLEEIHPGGQHPAA